MAATRQESPALFGVLKHAEPRFDIADNRLVIAFMFSLHSKKLEDQKQKALFISILQRTLGTAPIVEAIVDKSAVPPVLTEDPTVASVAAIMGGGEVIDAEAI